MKPRSPLTVAPIIDSVNTLSKKDTIMDAIMGKRYFFFTGGATSLASCVICTPVVCAPPTPIPKWPPLNPTPVPAVLVSIVDAPPRKATENLWMFSDPHCGQISILAPCVGAMLSITPSVKSVSILAPCEGSDTLWWSQILFPKFQFSLPVRGTIG